METELFHNYTYGDRMRIEDFYIIPAHVTFSNGKVRVFIEEGSYLVKFFNDGTYVGEIYLEKLEWGAFQNNNQLSDWRIEFWSDDFLVSIHHHLLHGSNVLFIAKPKSNTQTMVDGLIEDSKKAQEMGCITWAFFDGCHRYSDLLADSNIKTFEFSKDGHEEFPYIIEKNY